LERATTALCLSYLILSYSILCERLKKSSREKTCAVLIHVCIGGGIISIDKYIIISFRYNRII